MADGTDAPVNGRRRLPFFRSTRPDRPIARRRQSTVHWHRTLRSFLYLIAFIFLVLVEVGNTSNKPVLRNTYFLYLDLSNIIPVSVPNAVFINSIARSIGLHDFYQVGLWNFCEGYAGDGITSCSKPETLYAFNPVQIILDELLSGASIALPSNITQPLHLAHVASRWMSGIFLAATILNFVMIFLSPLAVSSRPPQAIKYLVSKNAYKTNGSDGSDGSNSTEGSAFGQLPHRRRTFILLRSLPFLFLTFLTALLTIVGSVVGTVMFTIFANVFANADPSLNIKAHVGKQMFAFMWVASAFSLIAFILQFGSCCAACCGGHKARKKFKQDGIDLHEKPSRHGSVYNNRTENVELHAVTTED